MYTYSHTFLPSSSFVSLIFSSQVCPWDFPHNPPLPAGILLPVLMTRDCQRGYYLSWTPASVKYQMIKLNVYYLKLKGTCHGHFN